MIINSPTTKGNGSTLRACLLKNSHSLCLHTAMRSMCLSQMDGMVWLLLIWCVPVRSEMAINKTVTIDRSSLGRVSLSDPAVQLIQGLRELCHGYPIPLPFLIRLRKPLGHALSLSPPSKEGPVYQMLAVIVQRRLCASRCIACLSMRQKSRRGVFFFFSHSFQFVLFYAVITSSQAFNPRWSDNDIVPAFIAWAEVMVVVVDRRDGGKR